MSRRRLLALSGGAAMGGLAGCQGGGGDNDTTSPETSSGGNDTSQGNDTTTSGNNNGGGQLQEPVLDIVRQAGAPSDWNMNNLGPPPSEGIYPRGILPWFWENFAWDFSGFFNPVTNIVKDYGFDVDGDPPTGYVEFKEGFHWWNGDPVTVEQNFLNTKIRILGSNDFYGVTTDVLQDVEKVNDYRLKYTYQPDGLPNPVSRVTDGRRGLLNGWAVVAKADVPPDFQRPFYEELTDASNEDAVFDASQRSVQKKLTIEDLMDNGWGNSPFIPKENGITDQKIQLEIFEDSPNAENINLEGVTIRNPANDDRQRTLIRQDQIDVSTGQFPERLEGAAPDYLKTITTIQGEGLWTIELNWNNKHLANRNVRRAIVSALPLDQMAQTLAAGEPTNGPDKQTGMDTAHNQKWFDESFMDSLIDYPYEADEEAAGEYMRQAGYEKSDGTWTAEDGSTPEFQIATQTDTNWALTGTVIAQFLKSFGLPASNQSYESKTWVQQVESGNFDIYPVKGRGNFKSYAHSGNFGSLGLKDLEASFSEGQTEGRWGKPLKPTIPSKVGRKNVSGSGKTLNLPEMYDTLITAGTLDQMDDLMKDFAWYWNYDLPHIKWYNLGGGYWGDTRHFQFPSTEDHMEAYYADEDYMAKMGLVRGKTK